jgi:hypothetical protein
MKTIQNALHFVIMVQTDTCGRMCVKDGVLWERLGVREKGQQEACVVRSVVMFSSDVSRVMKLRRMGWPCGIMREK